MIWGRVCCHEGQCGCQSLSPLLPCLWNSRKVLRAGFGSPAAEHTGLCLFMGGSILKKFCLDCSAREISGDTI